MKPPTLELQVLPDPLAELSPADRNYLSAQENRIWGGFHEVAEALHNIKTYKGGVLTKGFGGFENYVKARFSYGKAYGYRLAASGRFLSDLEADDEKDVPMPQHESQVRAVIESKIPEEHQVPFWKECAAHKQARDITAPAIKAAAKAYKRAQGIVTSKNASNQARESAEVRRIRACLRQVDALGEAVKGLGRERELQTLLKQMRALIQTGTKRRFRRE